MAFVHTASTSNNSTPPAGLNPSSPILWGSAAASAKPFTFFLRYKRSSWPGSNRTYYLSPAGGASTGAGFGFIDIFESWSATDTGNRWVKVDVRDYDGSGSAADEHRYQVGSTVYAAHPGLDTVASLAVTFGSGATPPTLGVTKPKVYVNGEVLYRVNKSNSINGGWPVCDDQVLLTADSGSFGFLGTVYEVGVFERALSSAEIRSLAAGFSCDHYPGDLTFHHRLIREISTPDINPNRVTMAFDGAVGAIADHDAVIYFPHPPQTEELEGGIQASAAIATTTAIAATSSLNYTRSVALATTTAIAAIHTAGSAHPSTAAVAAATAIAATHSITVPTAITVSTASTVGVRASTKSKIDETVKLGSLV